MEEITQEIFHGLPEYKQFLRISLRLLAAALLGGLVGYQREKEGKAAGLRTHMLVALGAAILVLIPLESGMPMEALSRVIEGITAGIGFIGAGAILKLHDQERIKGLTTASTIWLTTAVGITIGFGWLWIGIFVVGLTFAILALLGKWENSIGTGDKVK